jgi:hypothetical protein
MRVVAVRAGGDVDVDVTLLVPSSVWSHMRSVEHAGLVFLLGHAAAAPNGAADAAGECGVVGCTEHPAGCSAGAARGATLRQLLEELPSLQRLQMESPPPALLEDAPPWTLDEEVYKFPLHGVPESVLRRVLLLLEPADVACMACVCRGLRAIAACVPPGLGVRLYAHQQAALAWMQRRESAHTQRVPSPFVRECRAIGAGEADSIPLLVDALTNEVRHPWAGVLEGRGQRLPEPDVQLAPRDCRGGFFCDEPGMGKTVTILALVLRTRGCRAVAPAGAATRSGPGDTPPWYTERTQADQKRRCSSGTGARAQLGPAPGERILLSAATLVVVPANLVTHWCWQAA